MSPTQEVLIGQDRFGRAFRTGARIVYPTRRGSTMELIEAEITGIGEQDSGEPGIQAYIPVVFAIRKSGTRVTLRNLWNVVVVPS